MKIKIARHLKTTSFDAQFREKINVSFRITLNVTISDNLYIYVTKENNLLIHRLNSMNKDLHVLNVMKMSTQLMILRAKTKIFQYVKKENIMIRIKTLLLRHRRMSTTHFIKIDFLHMIHDLSNQFN